MRVRCGARLGSATSARGSGLGRTASRASSVRGCGCPRSATHSSACGCGCLAARSVGSARLCQLGSAWTMPRPSFRVIVPGWNLTITSMWIVSGSAYSLYLFIMRSHCKGLPRLRSRNKPSVLVSVNEQGVQTARPFVLVQAGTSCRPGYWQRALAECQR